MGVVVLSLFVIASWAATSTRLTSALKTTRSTDNSSTKASNLVTSLSAPAGDPLTGVFELDGNIFENAIAGVSATGGSTNAVLHLLAMAHEQLGDHATALAWYTASCLWQNEEVQTDPDVEARRFRAEAAELLAVPVEWPPAEWRAGEADLRLRARLDKSNPSRTSLSALQDLAVARRAESTEPAGPFGSAPALIPGIIQAEDFDRGGEGVAYHDVSYVGMHNRNPEPYRITGVDLEVCNDEGGGMHVGHVQPGEWLTYTVDVKEAGAYDLGLRVSTIGPAALYVEVDCKDVTGPFELPNTGGWDNWETLTKRRVHLEAGKRVIRVVFDRSDTGFVCNFNWLRLTASVPPGE